MNNWTELSADKLKVGGWEEGSREGEREGGVMVSQMQTHYRRPPACEEL